MNVAIVGCGDAGAHHVRAITAMGATVAAACDEDPSRASAVSAHSATFDELLTDPSIDAVAICTPPDTHVPLALEALAANKAVIVEKPIALAAGDLGDLLAGARRSSRPLVGMLQHRGRLALPSLGRTWSSSTVVTVEVFRPRPPAHYARAAWRTDVLRSGGGVFGHLAIHYVDLACQLLGRPTETFALTDYAAYDGIDSRLTLCARMSTGALLTVAAGTESRRRSSRLRVVDGSHELEVTDAETRYRAGDDEQVWPAPSTDELRARVYSELSHAIAGQGGAGRYRLDTALGAVELLEYVLECRHRSMRMPFVSQP